MSKYAAAGPAASAVTPVRRGGAWGDPNPWLKDPGPLVHGYNAATEAGYLSTSLMGVKEAEGQPAGQTTAVDVTYIYKQDTEKGRKGAFVLTVVSTGAEWRFLKANNLTVIVDEKNYPVGKPKRTAAMEEGKAVEKLAFEVPKAAVEKVVYGGEVTMKIGEYILFPSSGLQLLLYNMLQVAQ